MMMGVVILFFPVIVTAHALYTVPFNNIALNPSRQLAANYSFGPNQFIFCYTPDLQTIGQVTWSYRGKLFAGNLPIVLTTTPNTQGSLADPQGVITIINTSGQQIVVSCDFAL